MWQRSESSFELIEREERRRKEILRLKIILPILLVLVFFVYGYSFFLIPSTSMEPTLKVGDHILSVRSWLAYPGGRLPSRGDIILFRLPAAKEDADSGGDIGAPKAKGTAAQQPDDDILIKRVAALPGEKVQVIGNDVYVNGKLLPQEHQIQPTTDMSASYPYASRTPLKVPAGNVFVLGDNRDNSDDGRYWGTLPNSKIIGRFLRVLYNDKKGAEKDTTTGQSP